MNSMAGPVVILGATSQIARDFMVLAYRQHGIRFALFARRPEVVRAFVEAKGLPDDWPIDSLSNFARASRVWDEAVGLVNFVGVGDPAKAKQMGASIFDATLESEALARAFCAERPNAPYLFCSSGAVYGVGFQTPATSQTPSLNPVNQLEPQHWYGVAKLHAEAMHRTMDGATVLDLRIFNYFSRSQDIGGRFLITDMVRCVAEGGVFVTTDATMTRDYIHPQDLTALILRLLAAPAGSNQPVDAYSAAPITKANLIALFRAEFGLKVEVRPQADAVNATGAKPEYYSTNPAAAAFGYSPLYSSAQTVVEEARAMLDRAGRR
jgi:nucleoside-diphosphate-sugar epimerase